MVISFVEISKVQKKKNRLFLESFSALKKKKVELRLNSGEEEEAHGLISGIVSSLEGKVLSKSNSCKPIHHTSSLSSWFFFDLLFYKFNFYYFYIFIINFICYYLDYLYYYLLYFISLPL